MTSSAVGNVKQQVCFSLSLSKIKLLGLLKKEQVQMLSASCVFVLVSIVNEHFEFSAPVKIGPCQVPPNTSGKEAPPISAENPPIWDLKDAPNQELFIAATLNDIVYIEIVYDPLAGNKNLSSSNNKNTVQARCLGFSTVNVSHVVADSLDVPRPTGGAASDAMNVLITKLSEKDLDATSEVSTLHKALPSEIEGPLPLNGGTFFQRTSAPVAAKPTGLLACCAAPQFESTITANLRPITKKMVQDAATAATLPAPDLPAQVYDRCVVPLGLIVSQLKNSQMMLLLNNPYISRPVGSGPISANGFYAFEQPNFTHTVPGGVRQQLVKNTLQSFSPSGNNVKDWNNAMKSALSKSDVQPPLFVTKNKY